MKFTAVIISFVFYAFFSSASVQGFNVLCRLEKRRNKFRNEALCIRFVSESFKNTCLGKGFENLSEWKEGCRALWKLEYIDFRLEGELMCGVWRYGSERYEVFCGIKTGRE